MLNVYCFLISDILYIKYVKFFFVIWVLDVIFFMGVFGELGIFDDFMLELFGFNLIIKFFFE